MMTPPSPASLDPRIAEIRRELTNRIKQHADYCEFNKAQCDCPEQALRVDTLAALTASEQARQEAAQRVTALAQIVSDHESGVANLNRVIRAVNTENAALLERVTALEAEKKHMELGRRIDIDHAHKLVAERAAQDATITRLREALEKLVNRLDYVHADEQYKGVWVLAHVHGYHYTGPKYDTELEAARAALAAAPRPTPEGQDA